MIFNRKFDIHFFLYTVVSILIILVLVDYFFYKPNEYYLQKINKEVKLVYRTLEIQNQELKEFLIKNENPSLGQLIDKFKIPFIVYEGQNIAWYLNEKIDIPLQNGFTKEKGFIEFNNFQLLYHQQKVNEKYTIVSYQILVEKPILNFQKYLIHSQFDNLNIKRILKSKSEYNIYDDEKIFLFSVLFKSKSFNYILYLLIFTFIFIIFSLDIGKKINQNFSLIVYLYLVPILFSGTVFGLVYAFDYTNNIDFKIVIYGYALYIASFNFQLSNISKSIAKKHIKLYLLYIFTAFCISNVLFFVFCSSYFNSLINPEILFFREISFDYNLLFALVLILLCFYSIIQSSHVLINIFQFSVLNISVLFVFAACLFSLLYFAFSSYGIVFILSILLLYFLIFLAKRLKLNDTITRPRYTTYAYFFLFIVWVSFSISLYYVQYSFDDKLKILKKERENPLNYQQNNIASDLAKIASKIKNDKLIKIYFENGWVYLKTIEKKIDKTLLNIYESGFYKNIYIFDIDGNCLNQDIKGNYFNYYKIYNIRKYKTKFPNIFHIRDQGKLFYVFSELKSNSNENVGYVVIEIRPKLNLPNSVSTFLLSKNRNESEEKNFANFFEGKFLNSVGEFDYRNSFPELSSDIITELKQGIFKAKFVHFGYSVDKQNFTIVSLPFVSLKHIFFQFSLVFLFFTFFLFVFIIFNTVYYKLRHSNTSFTTKIQLFINLAFFIPLALISFFVYNAIYNSFKENIRLGFSQKAEIVSKNLSDILLNYKQNNISLAVLESKTEEISQITQTDLMLYNAKGKLITSTQKLLLENNLVSSFINPNAIVELKRQKINSVFLEERISNFNYFSVYAPIYLSETNELLGYLSIPFFESDIAFKHRNSEILIIIINLFTILFILFLGLSFWGSRILTIPLSSLTQKLREIDFSKNNTPLVYQTNDEIGILVKEYNKMILKLQESRLKLSATEKETAWKEMAKQVAHEIKNPLMPMKLTLQNWQIKIRNNDFHDTAAIKHSIESLLEQIDNLTEIANSFSSFAQMPEIEIVKFNISELLNKIITLFESQNNLKIETDIANNLYCFGDEKLMNRVIINLLTNALEAIPKSKKPYLKIVLKLENDKVLLSISDNGIGIAEELQTKIFRPNFSTKSSGSGIGLSIVKKGIEQMKGKVYLKSVEGEGTEFFIELNP